jgi:hypothetical protein
VFALKIVLNVAAAFTLWVVLLAGNASVKAEPGPAPGAAEQPIPGIMVTPPWLPPADTQQSCPDTGRKIELLS